MDLGQFVNYCKSTKYKVSLDRIMVVKRYFISMYRCNMFKLYDRYLVTDPFRFNKKEILKNLQEFGVLEDIISSVGRVNLNSDTVYFSLCKHRGDSEIEDFLSILYEVLKYIEYYKKVDMIYDGYKFYSARSGFVPIQLALKFIGCKVCQKSDIVFDYAFARVISSMSEDTVYESVCEKVWLVAMKELNIPECDWSKDGVFDKNLSHTDELLCMKGILNGDYRVSGGLHTDKLNEWFDTHTRSNSWSEGYRTFNTKTSSLGLFDLLFRQSTELKDTINEVVKIISSKGYNILAVEEDKVYYSKKREYIDFPYGVFAISCDIGSSNEEVDTLLPTGNALNGYSGEVYTRDRLINDDINYIGCPIMLDTVTVNGRGKTKVASKLFYDLEQTDIETNTTWFTENVNEYSFEENYTPINDDSLAGILYNGYLKALSSSEYLIQRFEYTSEWENFDKVKEDLFQKIL